MMAPLLHEQFSPVARACVAAGVVPDMAPARAWTLFGQMLAESDALDADAAVALIGDLMAETGLMPLVTALARRATQRFADNGRAWYLYGRALLLTDVTLPEILPALERAWALDQNAGVYLPLSLSAGYIVAKRYAEAEIFCHKALQHDPDNADAHANLALVLRWLSRPAEAVDAARQALRLVPDHPRARMALISALEDCGRFDDAYALLLELRQGDPQNQDIRSRPAEAVDAARQALRLVPDHPRARMALISALEDCGRFDDAYALLLELRQGDPQNQDIRSNLVDAHLRRRKWAEGWKDIAVRLTLQDFVMSTQFYEQTCGSIPWQGQPLTGKTLIVWAEQGSGDIIWLARFLPLIAQHVITQGGQIVFICAPAIAALLGPLFGAGMTLHSHDGSTIPRGDFHIPLMSCCEVFGLTDQTVPGTAYLTADQTQVAALRARITQSGATLNLGFVWYGNPQHNRDQWRSMPLDVAEQLLAVPHVRFHSINPAASGKVSGLRDKGYELEDWGPELPDFAATAALLRALDGVVTVDTSVAHLAGALGVPVLMMIDRVSSFLWCAEEARTPWYDSVRIFRQSRLNDWSDVIARVNATVAQWATTGVLEKV